MRLYIMRHGPAEDHAPTGRDFDRALTAKGRIRVQDVAGALSKKGELPTLLFSSPLVRARETAEIISHVTPGVTVEIARELVPGGQAYALAERLRSEGRDRVMLVGHEPDLSLLVENLSGVALPQGMQKAMVAAVAFAEPRSLTFLLEPKSLTFVST